MSSATLPPFAGAVRGAAFWLTVAMPLAYTYVLFVGPFTLADLATLVVLVAANVAALVVGHGYAVDE